MTQCPRCHRELDGKNRPLLVCGSGFVIDGCLICGSELVYEIQRLNEIGRTPDLPELGVDEE